MTQRTVLILVVAIAGIAAAAPACAAEIDLIVRDITGRTHTGSLVSFDEQALTIRTNDGSKTSITTQNLLRMDRTKTSAKASDTAGFIYLANGDRLAARPVKIDGDNLHAVVNGLPGQPKISLPMLAVRGFILQVPDRRAELARLEAAVLGHDQKSDVLLLRNGDRVTGRLLRFDGSHAAMSETKTKIPRSNIAAVAFDPRYVRAPRVAAPLLLQLTDGSKVTAKSVVSKSDETLQAELQFGGRVELPWTSLISLQSLGENVVPLSTLSPVAYKHMPYLTGARKLAKNRNVVGGPLKLRGREYAVGLGMHSQSRVSFAAPADAKHFLATIGIDDAAGEKGHAVFAVEVDAKRVFQSDPISGRSSPVTVGPVSLTGAKRLTLVVEFGPRGDIRDYADWCDAVVITK